MTLQGVISNLRLCCKLATQVLKCSFPSKQIKFPSIQRRFYPAIAGYSGGEGKTTVTILNAEDDAPLMINSYSQAGFRLNNGMIVIGPMVIFPKTVLSWNIGHVHQITPESLSIFYTLEPRIEYLVVGVGDSTHGIDDSWGPKLRKKGINVEILPTDKACSTFNFLNAERRSVAAALLPPHNISLTDQDAINDKIRKNELHRLDVDD